jgi:hypothetical protein
MQNIPSELLFCCLPAHTGEKSCLKSRLNWDFFIRYDFIYQEEHPIGEKNGMRYFRMNRVTGPKSTKKLKGYFWMKVMTEVKVILIDHKTITKNIIKRSVAFPRKRPLPFST